MVFMVEDEYRGRLNEGILRGSFWVSIEIDPVINVVDTLTGSAGASRFQLLFVDMPDRSTINLG